MSHRSADCITMCRDDDNETDSLTRTRGLTRSFSVDQDITLRRRKNVKSRVF